MSAGTATIDVHYRPGLLIRALMIVRAMGIRLPARFIAWAMQRSGKIRLGDGPWMPVRPGLPLRRAAR